MSFSPEEFDEFKTEALDLLDHAEKCLLALGSGMEFRKTYDSIFRVFHNLKGAAGMMDLTSLQAHTHELETILVGFKDQGAFMKSQVNFFLRGADACRALLMGEAVSFNYVIEAEEEAPAEPAPEVKPSEVEIVTTSERATIPVIATIAPDMSEALNEFFAESGEILDRVDGHLRLLEHGEVLPELVNDLYREIHSLKGTAYLFGFNAVGDLSHAMESGMELVRSGERALGESLMRTLFECTRVLDEELRQQKNGILDPRLHGKMLELANDLKTVVSQLPIPGSGTAPAATKLAAPILPLVAPKLPEPVVPAIATEPVAASVPASVPSQTTPVAQPSASFKPAVREAMKSNNGPDKDTEANSSIRVPVALLDHLMTLVGEMVLVRNQVLQVATTLDNPECLGVSKRLNVITTEIQGEMMKTRLQPVGVVLTKFHRVVRDLSAELKKDIQLEIEGGETELDKSLLEAIKDPLTHIVRNSCDHGIEKAEVRVQSGKPGQGNIKIRAYHEGGQVIVEINDDGKGLHRDILINKAIEKGIIVQGQVAQMSEKEIFALIFAPGFSTAAAVTNVSGRGVGMDVVRTNIERIGGSIELTSQAGRGTTTRLKIPLTMAIIPALIVKCGGGSYAIPQVKLEELVRIDADASANKIEFLQGAPVYRLRGQILPLVHMGEVLGLGEKKPGAYTMAVLSADNCRFGLLVDEVQDTGDIVVKPLNRLLKTLQVYSGATIMGDGSIAMILDVNGIAKVAKLGITRRASEESSAHRRERSQRALEQDFLLLRVNSPTHHAMLLNYVHRLEEFRLNEIEMSGQNRVVRYGTHILPLLSASEMLGYGRMQDEFSRDKIPVVVVQKGGSLYGLAVGEIMDTFRTETDVEVPMIKQTGIFGNLNLADRLVVAVDPFEMIDQAFPRAVAKTIGLQPIEVNEQSTGRARILVAEDTSFFRRAFTRVLTEAGHDVTVAEDGRDALDILERHDQNFDVVISDIEMPRMNGFDLARAIRENPRLHTLPLMAVSSRADGRSTEKGIESGFNIYLEKLKPELLLAGVNQLTKSGRKAA